MKHLIGFATGAVLLPMTAFGAATTQEISLKTTSEFVIPAYIELAKEAKSQSDAWNKSCNFDELKTYFQKTSDAWAHVQHINFGPITYLLRRDRLYHWPERRNSVNKGLNKLTSKPDVKDVTAEKIRDMSVAIQGLPALERVLYADLKDNPNACAIGRAIAGNIANITAGTVTDWNETLKNIKSGTAHPLYFDTMDEVALRLFTELLTGFQIISDQKIALPMGSSIKKANGKRAEAWRSERSTRYIQENVKGLIQMAAPFVALLPADSKTTVQKQLDTYANASKDLPASIKTAVKEESGRAAIKTFKDVHRTTRDLLFKEVTSKLGLSVGFNSLDGD